MRYIKDIAIGDKLTDCIFVLKKLVKTTKGDYSAVLADKTDTIPAVMAAERFERSMPDMVGGAVCLNGVVLNGTDMAPYVKIKSMTKAKAGSFKTSDLFQGLSEKRIAEYKGAIRDTISHIPNEACKLLCEKALSDEVLDTLSRMPASIGFHGRYSGGALATAATVSKMAIQAGVQYQNWNNGLYGTALNWSVLVTASLLHTLAVKEYFAHEQPWNKTEIGMNRGYFSLLQSDIEAVIHENSIQLDERLLSCILNVLGCAVSMKTSVKATCPEGILFRHTLMAYEDLDMLAEETANHEAEDGEEGFYSSRSKRYVVLRNDVLDGQEGEIA